MNAAVEVAGLRKEFGRSVALDSLDLTVETGQTHGFLGPNGAGKSTTIRILLGLVRKTAGAATLLGRDPWRDATELHQQIAYVPGDVTLWPNLSGGEIIDLLGSLRRGIDPVRKKELIERFDLDPTKMGRAYSKGNRQKVALVAALSANTDLLILDEPTSGLDPLMEEVFREALAAEKARGRTVLLSSHILSEVEAVCDRVSIIRAGRTVETGTLAEMRHLLRTSVDATVSGDLPDLTRIAGIHDLQVEGDRLRCQVDEAGLADLLGALSAAGVRTLTCQPPSLEELFLRHYSRPEPEPVTGTAV
ncbi:ABC transporter ATP-binding protein [Nakamurella silvestris]|nr:ABC transporter ATP-binding protein [Nakamurella silvestris]